MGLAAGATPDQLRAELAGAAAEVEAWRVEKHDGRVQVDLVLRGTTEAAIDEVVAALVMGALADDVRAVR